MNYSSIEQSKHLLKLGLSPESADACYDVGDGQTKAHIECENFTSYFTNDEFPELKDRYIPCWSVGALLELMPSTLHTFLGNTHLCMYKAFDDTNIQGIKEEIYHLSYAGIYMTKDYKNIIDACVEILEYLLQNNYIKTE